ISYSGSATDPEDGAIPVGGLSWTILVNHCPGGSCHQHTLTTGSGTGGSFTVPDHGDDTHLEIVLTAVDSGGLTGTSSVKIHPQTARITLASSPTGLTLMYDGVQGKAPFVRNSVVGSKHTIYAPSPQKNYVFQSWSDGGAQQHVITVGTSDATYTAKFVLKLVSL
ncbi:MAG: hypothetical protein M3198_02700, partial [Actinomycetota bacterium]|nr:hypothetical protein [Actinomycetota bacterium]